ncbi:MAG: CHAT domain-containing protein, partial [Myxococcota bacterium]
FRSIDDRLGQHRLRSIEAMLAEAVVDRTEERLWMMELRARIARRRGDFDASDRWVDEGLRRAGILHPDARRRLYRVRAEAAIDRADDERALLAFDAADEVLDERLSRIPFGEGRAAFLASIQSEQDVRLGLLVRSEQDERALEVLRRTRSRAVARAAMGLRIRDLSARARQRWEEDISAIRSIRRALQDAAEDAWTLDHDAFIVWQKTQAAVVQQMQDKLRAALKAVEPEVERVRNREAWTRSRPAPGDLWLAFGRAVDPHSAPRPDALVFVHTSSITKVLTYGPKLWTEAAGPWIRAARRIVILSSPSMLDAHTDPWRGIPLNIARPVAYTLDLPIADEGSSGWSPRALLVADPRRNLEGARREASAVSKAMRRAGFVVRALTGRHAELSAVVDGLETAATFHYAGHGHANPDEPWSDRLELSSDALRVSDILTLEHAPRFVVLTGCKTAFVSGEVERVHLAQAFLLAGSRQVVAAGRRVSDAFARSLGPRLYSKAPTDLMTRFAKAAAELEALGMTEWRAFRVWIP